MDRDSLKKYILNKVQANLTDEDSFAMFEHTLNGTDFLVVDGFDVGIDIRKNDMVVFDICEPNEKKCPIDSPKLIKMVDEWISERYGDAEPIEKSCEKCVFFTDFCACEKHGYNLSPCIKDDYIDFKIKTN